MIKRRPSGRFFMSVSGHKQKLNKEHSKHNYCKITKKTEHSTLPMTNKTFAPSSLFIAAITLLLITIGKTAIANEQIINIDGREVLLKEDGSWKYQSTDRFANTKDGRRVRLKEDGSWSYVGNAPLQSSEHVRTTDLDIKLQKVVIETYRIKTQKSTRIKTQTVFYVQLSNSPQAKTTIKTTNSDIAQIEIKDNNNKIYDVLSIKSDGSILKPGKETTLVVRAGKSPAIWDDAKSMEITFKAGILGLQKPVTLKQKIIDFEKEDVDNFE